MSKSKSGSTPQVKQNLQVVDKCISTIEAGKTLASVPWTKDELPVYKSLQLLSAIPSVYILNTDNESAANGNEFTKQVIEALKIPNYVIMSVQLEQESTLFGDSKSQLEYLSQFGVKESALNKVVSACSSLLGLNTFYTVGRNEARAWHTESGSTVADAGARIHSDFKTKFIKAEVMHYDDYVRLGGEENVKKAGKLFVEGPGYICQNNDILYFYVRK